MFAPSLFVGVISGMAFGDVIHHLFGAAAGQPALDAVVAMGAVFTSAARASRTSLASVVEMTGDFTLTRPVMLAVAIASTVSRSLSYGTIYGAPSAEHMTVPMDNRQQGSPRPLHVAFCTGTSGARTATRAIVAIGTLVTQRSRLPAGSEIVS